MQICFLSPSNLLPITAPNELYGTQLRRYFLHSIHVMRIGDDIDYVLTQYTN
jgi:hypothetical protein